MTFENFMQELGLLIRQFRNSKNLTLYQLSHKTDIVADHIQKIESAKHGGIQILTYAKLLSGLEVGLSFRNNKNEQLEILTKEQEVFLNKLFFNLPKDCDLQFLNYKPSLLLEHLAKQIYHKRKKVGLTQKQLSQKAMVSNTTISHIESGKYNFSLLSLYKITKALS
jgi:transcriptional regulator with XRE-family HTH domain